MAAVPGVLGGPLAGVIHVPGRVEPLDVFRVRLACIKTERTTSGGESSSTDTTLWEHEQQLDRDLSGGQGTRTLIPVKFLIPFELPASDQDVKWKLSVEAATRGVDFRTEFDVPVFQTETSSPKIDVDVEQQMETSSAPPDFATLARRVGAVVEPGMPSGRTLYFPMARNLGLALFVGVFCAIWIGICIALFQSDAPRPLPWIFSAFGALLSFATLNVCFGSTSLEYGPRGVAYAHRWFGIGRRREVARDQVATVEADASGTSYNGRTYQKVELRTVDNDRHILASEIARRQDAEHLATDIRDMLGLSESRSDGRDSRMTLEAELPSDFRGE
jgi:hypothetical protein